ncbi:uncharacterized protein BO80DRAFT_500428 [Aspergillus ibericus CBS 121593]|uniref:Uncharacterized protein n=1 Tax=Aspergillus ibericus CBS 121593 TaxID=1448316 RepID=A0A395H7Q1_9EURO|nr:hypothetical protein BO80DRAFT_500428 [Aspergillus ibericus CBS 121593]RAL03656.1 hypothetical protein BO80DRAFT_500428 [Aspergillus ibericus CBS 121593]
MFFVTMQASFPIRKSQSGTHLPCRCLYARLRKALPLLLRSLVFFSVSPRFSSSPPPLLINCSPSIHRSFYHRFSYCLYFKLITICYLGLLVGTTDALPSMGPSELLWRHLCEGIVPTTSFLSISRIVDRPSWLKTAVHTQASSHKGNALCFSTYTPLSFHFTFHNSLSTCCLAPRAGLASDRACWLKTIVRAAGCIYHNNHHHTTTNNKQPHNKTTTQQNNHTTKQPHNNNNNHTTTIYDNSRKGVHGSRIVAGPVSDRVCWLKTLVTLR